jgi:FkbM family methyltransferase
MMSLRRLAKYWLYSSVPGFAGRFPYYGTTVHFPPRAPIFRVICRDGRFEPEIIDRLVQLARPGTTVFDVGANLGLMAIPILHSCGSCRVVSFEPSPNSLSFLRQTISGAPFGGRWVLVEKALAETAGELEFTVGAPEDSLFEGFRSGDRIAGARTMPVAVSTLDEEWRALGRPRVSAVKIDVEGAEQQVLGGGRALLGEQRPAVLLEWHEAYLRRFGTPPAMLLDVAKKYSYQIFTVPHGVPVADPGALRVQMMSCQNFLLLAEGTQ